MEAAAKIGLFSLLFFSFILTSCSAQSCKLYAFNNAKTYASCNDLPVLGSYIHWTYNNETGTMDMAYRHTQVDSSEWVAWAINPTGMGMVGSQALVAYVDSNASVHAYTSPISSYSTRLEPGPLSFEVPKISAEFSNNEAIIYATLVLPKNMTTVHQVWQDGPVNGDSLGMHKLSGDNVRPMGTLDLLSGLVLASRGVGTSSRVLLKNVHGIINAVTWGTLMPMGAMTARYMKQFKSADPLWFYLHVGCQLGAYIGGIGGAASGFYLGKRSTGIQFDTHKNNGIVLLCLGLLQIFALFLRPKKDHRQRKYWNMYHHLTGYTTIVLSIINVYQGLDILNPGKIYKIAYTIVIAILGSAAVTIEAITWYTWHISKTRSTIESNDFVV